MINETQTYFIGVIKLGKNIAELHLQNENEVLALQEIN